MPLVRDHCGLLIDNYRVDTMLGRGGMGTVYRAVHEWTGREVALKFLNRDLLENGLNAQRFLVEARAAVSLRHPNVVDVLHMGEFQQELYMVLELLRGCSLRDWLTEYGPLSVQQAKACLLPIMEALSVAHGRGLVHRDIKPDNIFLAADHRDTMQPKLLDFGIVKLLDVATEGHRTATGALVGTPHYMSPEQVHGAQIDNLTDVWAMGILLYECLTGRVPFADASSLPMLALCITTEDVPPVSAVRDDLSTEVVEVVRRAVQRDPVRRFQSIEAMANALEAAGRDQPASPWNTQNLLRASQAAAEKHTVSARLTSASAQTLMVVAQAHARATDADSKSRTRRRRTQLLLAGLTTLALGATLWWTQKSSPSAPVDHIGTAPAGPSGSHGRDPSQTTATTRQPANADRTATLAEPSSGNANGKDASAERLDKKEEASTSTMMDETATPADDTQDPGPAPNRVAQPAAQAAEANHPTDPTTSLPALDPQRASREDPTRRVPKPGHRTTRTPARRRTAADNAIPQRDQSAPAADPRSTHLDTNGRAETRSSSGPSIVEDF